MPIGTASPIKSACAAATTHLVTRECARKVQPHHPLKLSDEYAKEPSTTLGLEAARASAQFEATMATAYEWDAPIQTSHNSLRTPPALQR